MGAAFGVVSELLAEAKIRKIFFQKFYAFVTCVRSAIPVYSFLCEARGLDRGWLCFCDLPAHALS